MRKKLLFVTILSIFLAVVLSGCSGHQHMFLQEWISDAETHWHQCGVEGCGEFSEPQPHKYGQWTAVDANTHVSTCVCGKTQTANHRWDAGVVTKDPNCLFIGAMTYTCLDCGETKMMSLPSDGHVLEYVPALSASCSGEGHLEYWKCNICGRLFSDHTAAQEVEFSSLVTAATGHSFGEPSWVWDGYSSATAFFRCEKCGLTHVLGARSREISSTVTEEPSCSKVGTKVYTATVVFEKEEFSDSVSETLPKLAHNYDGAVPYWHVSFGSTEYDGPDIGLPDTDVVFFCCNNCDELNGILVYLVGCTVKVTEATCTEAQVTTYKYVSKTDFGVLTHTVTDVAEEPLGHDFSGDPKWNWTGHAACQATFRCSRCSLVERVSAEEIAEEVTTQPTCTEKGVTTYTATVVRGEGDDAVTFTSSVTAPIAATGHDFSDVEAEWTWQNLSYAKASFKCNNCDYVRAVTASGNNIMKEVTVKPTCEEEGTRVYTATVLFKGSAFSSQTSETLDALGHSYIGVKPTWVWDGFDSATATFLCARCQGERVLVAQGDDITSAVTRQPLCLSVGVRTYTASVVLESKQYVSNVTEAIEPLGHSYGQPQWSWNGYSNAVAVFPCTRCNDKQRVSAGSNINSETDLAPTCTEKGNKLHTATVEFLKEQYSDTVSQMLAELGHDYSASWAWRGFQEAEATVTCSRCDSKHIETVSEAITSKVTKAPTCEEEGQRDYTAQLQFAGNWYSDIACEAIDAIGHNYSVSWRWSDYSSATATFVCSNCGEQHSVVAQDNSVTSRVISQTTKWERGTKQYTATVIFNGMQYSDQTEESISYVALDSVDTLLAFAESVNSQTSTYEGMTVVLENDIDISDTEWTPIGSKEEKIYFMGTFDGNNHSILGMNISQGDYVGFFGAIKDAEIKDLTVYGEVNGSNAAGVVARMESGVLNNCTNRVNVTSSGKAGGVVCLTNNKGCTISNCTNYGNISGGAAGTTGGVAGIVAYANPNTSIDGCTSYGVIGGAKDKYVAGIAGYCSTTYGSVSNCTNYATVVSGASDSAGGIIATASGVWDITRCYNYGTINSGADASDSTMAAGGIVGGYAGGTILFCGNFSTVHGRFAGGIVGIVSNTSANAILRYCEGGTVAITTPEMDISFTGHAFVLHIDQNEAAGRILGANAGGGPDMTTELYLLDAHPQDEVRTVGICGIYTMWANMSVVEGTMQGDPMAGNTAYIFLNYDAVWGDKEPGGDYVRGGLVESSRYEDWTLMPK